MEPIKIMVLMVITSAMFEPVNLTEFDEHPKFQEELPASSESPYMCPLTTASLNTEAGPSSWSGYELISWHHVVENLASFVLTFTYCHCNFIAGFERYTWTQLISNSVLSLVIHPFIYGSSWALDHLMSYLGDTD